MKETGELDDVFAILSESGFLGMAHLWDEPELFGTRQGVIHLQGALERQQRIIDAMHTQDRGVRQGPRRLPWVFPGKREKAHASPGECLGEPATHMPLIQDMMLP